MPSPRHPASGRIITTHISMVEYQELVYIAELTGMTKSRVARVLLAQAIKHFLGEPYAQIHNDDGS